MNPLARGALFILFETVKLHAVIVLDPKRQQPAQALADSFGVPLIDGLAYRQAKGKQFERLVVQDLGRAEEGCVFLYNSQGLSLYAMGPEYQVGVRADFHGPTVSYRRHKGGGRGQMIAKAVGLGAGGSPSVLDATAGLGSDAFVLASLGCQLTLLERVPEVRALLSAGLAEARDFAQEQDPELLEVLDRMQLVAADAHAYLSQITECAQPDVIYLDPMFPEPGKRAMVKKEMRVFHQLVGKDLDASTLLDQARAIARYRVVVKRPRLAPVLGGVTPSHVLQGKRNRYDVYTIRKMEK